MMFYKIKRKEKIEVQFLSVALSIKYPFAGYFMFLYFKELSNSI